MRVGKRGSGRDAKYSEEKETQDQAETEHLGIASEYIITQSEY